VQSKFVLFFNFILWAKCSFLVDITVYKVLGTLGDFEIIDRVLHSKGSVYHFPCLLSCCGGQGYNGHLGSMLQTSLRLEHAVGN